MNSSKPTWADYLFRAILCGGWLAAIVALWLVPPRSVFQTLGLLVATYLLLWGVVASLASGSLAQWRVRFFAATVSLAFTMVLVEIPAILGVIDYRVLLGTLGDEPWRNPANRLDPDLLHIHKPHQHYQGIQRGGDISFYVQLDQTADYPFDVRTDQHGFRNSQDFSQAELIVVGDSFIEAATVSQEEMLTSVLAKRLDKSVVNLGQLWYGPQQELAVLQRYGLPLKPSVCVWAFFEGNDLSDFRRYKDIHGHWPQFSRSLHSARQKLFSRNAIFAAFQLLGRPDGRPAGSSILGRCVPDGEPMYFYYKCPPLTVEDLRTLDAVQTIFKEAFALCEAAGIRFVVAMVPTKYRVYRDLCDFDGTSMFRFWQPNNLPELLGEKLRELSPDIGFVDLTDPLREAARQGTPTYFPDDTHWTPAGHAIAAEAIANYLKGEQE